MPSFCATDAARRSGSPLDDSGVGGRTVATRYTYLWEFLVVPERLGEFERHYGHSGTWAALFRQSSGYIETLLLRDFANPLRFITIDRWKSLEAYQSFRLRFSREYAELDERCQHFTTKETSLGEYDEAIV
jgi:hypothetical protein